MKPAVLFAQLPRLQDAFAALTADADLDATVPGLGDWRVRSLVVHLAGIHHWAAGMVTGDRERSSDLDVPADVDAAGLAALYTEHAEELRAALKGVRPTTIVDTLVGRGPASFWLRRQTHETLVHLGDLAAARAGAWTADVLDGVVEIEPGIWADGVDEVVTMFEPRQVRLGRIAPLPRLVALNDADGAGAWVLGAHETGRYFGDPRAAVVTAPARELDLVLWGRISPDAAGLEIDGDPTALADALAAGIVP